jgi:hypothetical protein
MQNSIYQKIDRPGRLIRNAKLLACNVLIGPLPRSPRPILGEGIWGLIINFRLPFSKSWKKGLEEEGQSMEKVGKRLWFI